MIYDIGIIGAGISGVFAAYKISKEQKKCKTILIELGRPPLKRRRQLEGWLGALPGSDGKLYMSDVDKCSSILGARKSKSCTNFVLNTIKNISDLKVVKDKGPLSSMQKKIQKNGFNLELNDYSQMSTKDIHNLSKFLSNFIDTSGCVTYSFDNEVFSVSKSKGTFVIQTQLQEIKCKKILVCAGRSGWRWSTDLFKKMGIVESNDISKYGIRLEMPASVMKDFGKSTCSLLKDNIEIGPINWYGTVIPEDHVDMAISAFRSNENRWKTDKVSFNLIGNITNKNRGCEQTDRLAKLAFVLGNDRIVKERVSSILTDKSIISIIPEYNWVKDGLKSILSLVPEIQSKAYFHIPTIITSTPQINVAQNMETEVDGLFVAGESCGIRGILSAAITGSAAVDGMIG